MGRSTRLKVFVNPAAGRRSERRIRRVAAALAEAGAQSEIVEVAPGELRGAVAAAARAGAEAVGVAGGDGTLRAAAVELVGSECALAPFATGTLNNFCRRMDLRSVDRSARAVVAGGVREVAVGQAGYELFLNSCICGVYAHIVRRREWLRGALGKWPAAVVATTEMAIRLPLVRVAVEIGPDLIRRTTPVLWTGLGRGSFPRTARAEPAERPAELEIVILRADTRLGALLLTLRYLPRMFPIGPVKAGRSWEVLHAGGLLVGTGGELEVTLDGEPLRLPSPFRIGLHSERLRVVAPAGP